MSKRHITPVGNWTVSILFSITLTLLSAGCSDNKTTGDVTPKVEKGTPKELNAEKAILKELKKLDSYTEAGLDYGEYQKRVLDAKGEIDILLPDIPDSPPKDALKASLSAYVDARNYWAKANEPFDEQTSYLAEEDYPQFTKYGAIKKGMRSLASTKNLPLFWRFASDQTKEAEKLIAKQ